MSQSKLLLVAISLFVLSSCSQMSKKEFATSADISSEAVLNAATDSASTDVERNIIKTAQIDLKVENLISGVEVLKSNVNHLGGRIFHLELKSNRYFDKEIQKNLDSSITIYKVDPTANMKMKIPVEHSDSFISSVLRMNASIDNLMLDEEDITENLTEKGAMAKMETDYFDKNKNVEEGQFERNNKIEQIQQKVALAKLNHQTKYLWFDVNMKASSYSEQELKANFSKSNTPFYVSLINALNVGWQGFSMLIIALMHVWPLWVILFLVYLAWRKKWFRHVGFRTSVSK